MILRNKIKTVILQTLSLQNRVVLIARAFREEIFERFT